MSCRPSKKSPNTREVPKVSTEKRKQRSPMKQTTSVRIRKNAEDPSSATDMTEPLTAERGAIHPPVSVPHHVFRPAATSGLPAAAARLLEGASMVWPRLSDYVSIRVVTSVIALCSGTGVPSAAARPAIPGPSALHSVVPPAALRSVVRDASRPLDSGAAALVSTWRSLDRIKS